MTTMLRLAWRNLWRNRRRTLITLTALIFGLAATLISAAFGDGVHNQVIELGTSSFLGHAQIHRKGYREERSLYKHFGLTPKLRRILDGDREIAGWAPRAYGQALVSTGPRSAGGMLVGIDPRAEARATRFASSVYRAYLLGRQLRALRARRTRNPATGVDPSKGRGRAGTDAVTRDKRLRARAAKEADRLLKTAGGPKEVGRKLAQMLAPGKKAAVIGDGLATYLKARVGDQLAIITQGADGSAGAGRFTVIGIVRTGSSELDQSLCVLGLATLQELLAMEGRVHEIAMTARDIGEIDDLHQRLAGKLKAAGAKQLEVLPWQVLNKELYEVVLVDDAGLWVMVFLIFLVVALGIMNTLLMSVLERTREFAVLRSIGMSGKRVATLMLTEAFLLLLVGLAGGMIIGLPIAYWLEAAGVPLSEPMRVAGVVIDSAVRGEVTLRGFLLSVGIIGLTTMLAALYPAIRAARLKPAEGLRAI